MYANICRRGFSLLELLVVIAIIGILMGLTMAGVQRVRASAARTQCQNHLRQIGLGLSNYHSAHGQLPPGVILQDEPGTFPWMSWEVHILPHIEQDAVWRQSLEAIKTKTTFTLSPPHPFTTVITIYGCPADGRVQQIALSRGHFRSRLAPTSASPVCDIPGVTVRCSATRMSSSPTSPMARVIHSSSASGRPARTCGPAGGTPGWEWIGLAPRT